MALLVSKRKKKPPAFVLGARVCTETLWARIVLVGLFVSGHRVGRSAAVITPSLESRAPYDIDQSEETRLAHSAYENRKSTRQLIRHGHWQR